MLFPLKLGESVKWGSEVGNNASLPRGRDVITLLLMLHGLWNFARGCRIQRSEVNSLLSNTSLTTPTDSLTFTLVFLQRKTTKLLWNAHTLRGDFHMQFGRFLGWDFREMGSPEKEYQFGFWSFSEANWHSLSGRSFEDLLWEKCIIRVFMFLDTLICILDFPYRKG